MSTSKISPTNYDKMDTRTMNYINVFGVATTPTVHVEYEAGILVIKPGLKSMVCS